MNSIDAVEGTVKCILNQLHSTYIQTDSDDSEFIQLVKDVIDATDQYIRKNPELTEDPNILKQVLYVYSRNLWLMGQQKEGLPIDDDSSKSPWDNDEYQTYYFDYLYDRGVYPS